MTRENITSCVLLLLLACGLFAIVVLVERTTEEEVAAYEIERARIRRWHHNCRQLHGVPVYYIPQRATCVSTATGRPLDPYAAPPSAD